MKASFGRRVPELAWAVIADPRLSSSALSDIRVHLAMLVERAAPWHARPRCRFISQRLHAALVRR